MESMNHSNKPINLSLKKMTQILISVTAFSFLFSQSSLVPTLVHSYDYLLSNFNIKFKLFTYTTERNCIFLLCNGILVLIIQSSGLISKIPPLSAGRKVDEHHGPKDGEIGKFQQSEKKGVGKAKILEEKTRLENEGDISNNIVAEIILEGVEDHEEEEDVEGIDRDELNKKCEDFIKKVKQEILMIQK